ncbi:ethanolamine kinase 1-like isoform X1 [Stegodyphus dumicola]|uniref:ethanolamine kinase 1-like isoform X1 n=2 Tax=Stegodyphus dumicola TaxID=202533 RepID=UPI0015B09438|nr:ethanolamine kinase 1-like isoform X1 [Stegodyphus dumicola]XP_035215188.1 ethanolamine kinase 1-like isoform X1 [Stegodyphus dumicola]XP_035215189.1 ethanolamine kinase 1-like isoform X1 [Stegodyphus dumicola]XP_035215190.1 ethanolamine kinase 1-like isoform X1 [Stegodyphus dumicola]XP_035215191.1 ethanolamine kinase 1-like isoform X1 [Stegodyphus dumicola]
MPNNANGIITRLDITVLNDSFSSLCSGAKEVINMVKSWKSDSIDFELFKDGITNHLVKCYMKDNPDNAVLIRVYGEKTELFIDRDLEVRNMQMMCDAGLCAPLYCAFTNGLCYGFSPGEVLDTKTVRDPIISQLIARRLAKMHSIRSNVNGVIPQPSLFPVLHKYLQLIPTEFCDPIKDERFKSCIPSKDVLEIEINSLKKHLTTLESPVVFCHNDLLLKNVIYNKEKNEVTFIDYEYADYNYQALDIGNHFCEFAGVDQYEPELYPNKEFQLKWLKDYLEAWYEVNGWSLDNITDEAVQLLYIQVNKFALAAHLFWGIWALIQSAHSTLGFDFLGYAKQRLDEYFARKEDFLSLKMNQNCRNGSTVSEP